MTAKDVLKSSLDFARGVTQMLLADLSDADLLVDPFPEPTISPGNWGTSSARSTSWSA